MANLSQQKRERMLSFLETLKAQHTDDDSLMALGEIEKELKAKKYGLVWEEHEETVDVMMQTHIPVFTEDASMEINGDPSSNRYNFLLEGDNLHSLRLLEKTHRGKIDVIYIDPPYNTGGNDFVYDDCMVGKDDGFRHSKWISFMACRLQIAQKLLSNGGVIFISIDDNEYASLKLLCDNIFGEERFLSSLARRTINSGKHDAKAITTSHDYILVYTNNPSIKLNQKAKGNEEKNSLYNKTDEYVDERGRHYITQLNKNSLQYSDALNYPIVGPDGIDIWPGNGFEDKQWIWRWSKDKVRWGIEKGFIVFKKPGKSPKYKVYTKSYEFVDKDGNQIVRSNPNTTLDFVGNEYTNFNATPELENLMGAKKTFDYPKPVNLIKALLALYPSEKFTVLDFFAGSGTTGQAVMELNQQDGGQRKFILCTNNENGICENVTYQRLKTVITGKRKDGSVYSDGIPANLMYFRTDFVSKESEELSEELLTHIREMIQLEHGIKIDNQKYIVIMNDEEMDDFEKNIGNYPQLKAVFINQDVFLSSSQEELLENIDTYIIPDYYFDFELREAGEIW